MPAPARQPDGLPQREKPAPASERAPLDIARRIVELAEDKKAADIVLLDLTGLTTMTDSFVIASGGSERQPMSAEAAREQARAELRAAIREAASPEEAARIAGVPKPNSVHVPRWFAFAVAAVLVASPIANPRLTMMLHFWLMNVLMMGV